jgi:hypothetical protein
MLTNRSSVGLIAIAVLGSAQVLVTDRNSTWQEIRADPSLNVQAQTVAFGGVFVPVLDLCTQDGQIQAIKPDLPVCRDPAQGEANCDMTTVHLSRPLVHQEYVCTKPLGGDGTCDPREAELVTVTIPTHYEVPVHTMNWSDPAGGQLLFAKSFDVPACGAVRN